MRGRVRGPCDGLGLIRLQSAALDRDAGRQMAAMTVNTSRGSLPLCGMRMRNSGNLLGKVVASAGASCHEPALQYRISGACRGIFRAGWFGAGQPVCCWRERRKCGHHTQRPLDEADDGSATTLWFSHLIRWYNYSHIFVPRPSADSPISPWLPCAWLAVSVLAV